MAKEIEFKFRVADEGALNEFALSLGLDRREIGARHQENTFFDSADGHLRKRGLALRLRREGERAVLTIKGKAVLRSEDGVLLERFEAEEECADAAAILEGSMSPLADLEHSVDAALLEGAAAIKAALAGAELISLGSFDNERTTLPPVDIEVDGGVEQLVFELDRTSFPNGRVDCEIEVEIGPDADAPRIRKGLDELFERAGIPWVAASSKIARFMEAQSPGA